MENKELKKTQELLKRVFKLIAESHFRDYKLIAWYCSPVIFSRGLGEEIANYIQSVDSDYYHKLRKKVDEEKE